MAKGKTRSDAVSAYQDTTNEKIQNFTFQSKRNVIPKKKDRKSVKFYARNLRSSNSYVGLSRNPTTIFGIQARSKFYRLVKSFENANEIKLYDLSKQDLMFAVLNYAETHQSVLRIKDDSKQFLPYKCLFPDLIKLYLYKLFYPRVFDFEINEENKITFLSDYVENNFDYIYQNIEMLCLSMVYDAMIIAIEKYLTSYIVVEKTYPVTINPKDSILVILQNIKNNIREKSNFYNILIHLLPSAIFMAKHSLYTYKGKVAPEHPLVKYLKADAFYSGKRADDARNALFNAHNECKEVLNYVFDFLKYIDDEATELDYARKTRLPFTRLINLYYINERSGLYDLYLLKTNKEFEPYKIDGIVSKHLIDKMIKDNNSQLNINSSKELELNSIYNNPNCIISNISSRDYEMLDFIISSASQSMNSYYLNVDGENNSGEIERNEISASRLSEIIDFINTVPLSKDMSKYIDKTKAKFINNVDYDRITTYRHYFCPNTK